MIWVGPLEVASPRIGSLNNRDWYPESAGSWEVKQRRAPAHG